jgi:hypothetical protein
VYGSTFLPDILLLVMKQSELDGLERRWRRRLEMQLRESAKKAAASAAAAAAATGRPMAHTPGAAADGSDRPAVVISGEPNLVTQTASWLDRAKSILQDPSPDSSLSQKSDGIPSGDIMNQLHEVQRLIHEGPVIHQTSAGLSEIMDQVRSSSGTASPPSEPADKRLRSTGAEDAEALVGFLRSVRASAASGEDL